MNHIMFDVPDPLVVHVLYLAHDLMLLNFLPPPSLGFLSVTDAVLLPNLPQTLK